MTLWSGNHIGHDSTIGDHCFISSHVVVSGHVDVGPSCFIGVNATLRNSIAIGERTLIGAGAVIMKNTRLAPSIPVREPSACQRTAISWTCSRGLDQTGTRSSPPARHLGSEPMRHCRSWNRTVKATACIFRHAINRAAPRSDTASLPSTRTPASDRFQPSPVGPGALGAFDDAGVTTACLVREQGRTFLYYTGWSLGVSVPFYLNVGLAVSDGGTPYRRLSPAPLLERCAVDP